MVVKDEIFYLRVARGLAPISIKFEREFSTPSLAVGANQKSTVSIGFDNKIITSAHIGDLDSIDSVKFFEKNIDILKRFYEFRPQNILCDLHEDYESSKWAKEQNLPLQKLPHHFSHTLAVLAEHNCFDEVLSFVWDGTGLGVDGKIWGGEVLLASVNGFERVGHFREFRLLGGERAIKEPKRVALALLFEVLELDKILKLKNPTISSFKEFEIKALYKTWQKGLNSPPTSSAGRLFDAFGSLAGLLQESSYEGESGLILESNYTKTDKSPQNLLQIRDGVIDWENLLKSSLTLTAEEISTNFIDSLAGVVAEFAQIYNDKKIILAGGVWQNRTLLERVLDIIPRNRVLLPKKLPLNDGSISVGQLFWQINKK
jgi:hydrogenase maturation protein HypF